MTKKMMLIYGSAIVIFVGLVIVGVMAARNNGHLINNAQQQLTSESATHTDSGQMKPQDAAKKDTSQAAGETAKNGSSSTNQPQESKENGSGKERPQMMLSAGDLAQVLGITEEELQTQLKAGITLEQIASSKGMTLDQLKEKWLANIKTALDNQVSQGELTAEQAQSMLTRFQNADLSKFGSDSGIGMGGDRPPGGPGSGALQNNQQN